jgi:hypothetical protein
MKNVVPLFLICVCVVIISSFTQLNSEQDTNATTSISPIANSAVYGVFVGRTPCQEFLKEFNLGERAACTKRKLGMILYEDAVTHQPTVYETWGMDKLTGKGKWHILQGTATDPQAVVFQLDLGANTFMYLLKGDENVLFILDKNRNFLIGNADHSYTLNREGNKIPWEQELYLINKGSSN